MKMVVGATTYTPCPRPHLCPLSRIKANTLCMTRLWSFSYYVIFGRIMCVLGGGALYIANWSASCQLGFLTWLCSFIYYLFPLFQWHACKLAISLRYEAKVHDHYKHIFIYLLLLGNFYQ